MAKIYGVQCDQCKKQEKDPGKSWIHISAKCGAAHARHMGEIGAALHGRDTTVNVTGAFNRQFVEADLCSPECAGAFLFGQGIPAISSRSSTG